jgi:hypothetical protein
MNHYDVLLRVALVVVAATGIVTVSVVIFSFVWLLAWFILYFKTN